MKLVFCSQKLRFLFSKFLKPMSSYNIIIPQITILQIISSFLEIFTKMYFDNDLSSLQ